MTKQLKQGILNLYNLYISISVSDSLSRHALPVLTCLLEPRHTLVRSIAFRSTSMSSQLTPAALLEWENIHTMMDIFNQRSMQLAAPRHLQKILSLQKSNEITGPTWPDVIMIRICLFYCLLYFLIVSNFYECFIHRKQNPTKIVIG